MIPILEAIWEAADERRGGEEFQAWVKAIDATERARAAFRAHAENDSEAEDLADAVLDCVAAEDLALAALRLALANAYRRQP